MHTRSAQPAVAKVAGARPKAPGYKNQLKKYLENKYQILSCSTISAVMKHVDFDCQESDRLLRLIENTRGNIVDLDDAVEIMAKVRAVFPAIPKIQKVFLKNDRLRKSFRVTNPTLLRDIQATDVVDLTDDDKENDHPPPAQLKDELVECGCCYGDYSASDMKECTANVGHQVCKDCISRYVSEQLDGNNCIEFKCIVDEDCGQPYHHVNVLEEVLSPRLKKRTNDAILLAAAKEAGLDVWTSQKCQNFGVLDDDSIKIVYCQRCNDNFCRKCHRVAHMRKTCEEVQAEEDRAKDPVNRAHEAMSKAVTRHCPKCLTPFVKHDGCNKMTCRVIGCRALSCYLCGVQVQDYTHFCNCRLQGKNIPCPCGQPCRLFTSTEEMDERDRKARLEAGRKVLQGHGLDENRIRDILQSPDTKKKEEGEKTPTVREQGLPAAVPRPAMLNEQRPPFAAEAAVERARRAAVVRLQRRAQRLNAPPGVAVPARDHLGDDFVEIRAEARLNGILRNGGNQSGAAARPDPAEVDHREVERLQRQRLAERQAQVEQRRAERQAAQREARARVENEMDAAMQDLDAQFRRIDAQFAAAANVPLNAVPAMAQQMEDANQGNNDAAQIHDQGVLPRQCSLM